MVQVKSKTGETRAKGDLAQILRDCGITFVHVLRSATAFWHDSVSESPPAPQSSFSQCMAEGKYTHESQSEGQRAGRSSRRRARPSCARSGKALYAGKALPGSHVRSP